MDKKILQDTFRKFKKASGVRYAITNPDRLGDCQSDVNYVLCEKYGEESKGVWVKHWTRGMNADYPLEYKRYDGKDAIDHVYVAHDLDDGQVATFYEVVGENYNILPKQEDFSHWKCFCLYEKTSEVWVVSFEGIDVVDKDGKGHMYFNEYTNIGEAITRMNVLFGAGYCPTLTRVF